MKGNFDWYNLSTNTSAQKAETRRDKCESDKMDGQNVTQTE